MEVFVHWSKQGVLLKRRNDDQMSVGDAELTIKRSILPAELPRAFMDSESLPMGCVLLGLQIIFRPKTVFRDYLRGPMFCAALFVKHWTRAIRMFLLIG